MLDKYRDYFDIDPEYFPQINEKVINNNPDIWKKFYPHETFVKLLKDTVSVISRKQKVSIWVEGAYGTGKSHAVLSCLRLRRRIQRLTLINIRISLAMIYIISSSSLKPESRRF